MSSRTSTLEFVKTQKIGYGWHVIKNHHPRISLKNKKQGMDAILSETTTLELH